MFVGVAILENALMFFIPLNIRSYYPFQTQNISFSLTNSFHYFTQGLFMKTNCFYMLVFQMCKREKWKCGKTLEEKEHERVKK